ncbi:MAG: metallophosphoesterase [Sedimentisphaerales bacterium]|nr:metallophosphoesterase [Sedimentisphaerales bacterium]
MTSKEIIAAFEQGAKSNRQDRWRAGNVIRLEGPGEVVMTGDLHGHERNFYKLVRFSNLMANPNRHLIIHELIHCSKTDQTGQCHSYNLVAQAALLKADFPDQVHYLLGNHAMAQITNDEVIKSGQPMVRALNAGLEASFGSNAPLVSQALNDFLLSLPIAAVTDNHIWMSHSLPSLKNLEKFDNNIFDDELTMNDMRSNDSLRALIWDRLHNEECLDRLSEMWDSNMFIVGHQPQGQGHSRSYGRLIILACDHNHGCFLPFELKRKYKSDELFQCIKPLAGVE